MMAAGYATEHGEPLGETLILLHGGNIANWMWAPQVEQLAGRHILTPDVVGFGSRSAEAWTGLAGAADDIAALIRDKAVGGRAHVVGLSMGGVIGIHLAARHPDIVRSCMVTGAAMRGVSDREAGLARLQLRAWDRSWFWKLQALAFRVPADSRSAFVEVGMGVRKDTAERMYEEIFAGSLPPGRFDYDGPMLAIAGEREPRSVAAAFPALVAAMPQTRTWIAPRMRHVWNIQDPDLFTRTIVDFADRGITPQG